MIYAANSALYRKFLAFQPVEYHLAEPIASGSISREDFHAKVYAFHGEAKVFSATWIEEVMLEHEAFLKNETSKLSFAYQPVESMQGMISGAESLYRGVGTCLDSAPGPLFGYLYANSSQQQLALWKELEIKHAIAASTLLGVPISINFCPEDITHRVLDLVAGTFIVAELLEKHSWSIDMVAKMKTVFYQVHADDVTLQTWPAYEAFIGLGLIDAIKIDLLTCIAAFQVMVRPTPTSPEVLYFMEHRLAHEGEAVIILETLKKLIINTLTSHRDMVVILEASVDRDIIDKHFGDVARRIYVQGGSTCALAFLPFLVGI